MSVIYLSSVDGNDADNGSTWALAKATLAAALTAAGAGDTVYVDNAHAETQASAMTLTSPGTAASPVRVLCASRASGAPPTALATTGTVSVTGNNISITYAGYAYCYGITFTIGSSGGGSAHAFGNGSAAFYWVCEHCGFVIPQTTTAKIVIGSITVNADQRVEWINVTVSFAGTGNTIQPTGSFVWRNTGNAIVGAAVPTVLFTPVISRRGPDVTISGVDLSALGSGKTLIDVSQQPWSIFDISNCKLGSSVAITTGNIADQGGAVVRVVNSDSANTNYRYYKQNYFGVISQETTIVKTSGASDGTTPISRKMVTTANSQFYSPLESDPITIWNESTSSVTVTVDIVNDGTTLTNGDCWIECEYLGTSGFPQSVISGSRVADILTSTANIATSSATWTTTGLTTPIKQKMSCTFTPTVKGPIKIRVMLAKASQTIYVDPQAQLQAGRTYQVGALYINEPTVNPVAYSRARTVNQ